MYSIDLKNFRKDNNLTQSALAKLIGVKQPNISDVENGEMKLPEEWIPILSKKFPNINSYNIGKTDIDEFKEPETNYKKVPYIGQEISATASMAMSDAMPINTDTYVRLPMFTRAEYILPVRGHSMKGYIDHGDFIAVRRITNIELIIYGEPYVIITRETNMRTVKFVNMHEDESKLWLSPYNTEQFNSQPILKTDILEMYVVLGKLKDLNI